MRPLLDQRTASKVHMINSTKALLEAIPSEYVPQSAGGTSTHTFDPSVFDHLRLELEGARSVTALTGFLCR